MGRTEIDAAEYRLHQMGPGQTVVPRGIGLVQVDIGDPFQGQGPGGGEPDRVEVVDCRLVDHIDDIDHGVVGGFVDEPDVVNRLPLLIQGAAVLVENGITRFESVVAGEIGTAVSLVDQVGPDETVGSGESGVPDVDNRCLGESVGSGGGQADGVRIIYNGIIGPAADQAVDARIAAIAVDDGIAGIKTVARGKVDTVRGIGNRGQSNGPGTPEAVFRTGCLGHVEGDIRGS